MRGMTITLAAAAFALGGLAAGYATLAEVPHGRDAVSRNGSPAWREVQWPFPMDQWGKGTAFQCRAADCGAEVNIYLRAKIGFCNCTSGIDSDADLDRVGDLDLFGGALYPQAAGEAVKVAWMKGRSRPFAVRSARGDATLISIGMHDNCDALVASAVMPRERLTTAESIVMEFLNSRTVRSWAEVTLGL
jgi:hypothetical protein